MFVYLNLYSHTYQEKAAVWLGLIGLPQSGVHLDISSRSTITYYSIKCEDLCALKSNTNCKVKYSFYFPGLASLTFNTNRFFARCAIFIS